MRTLITVCVAVICCGFGLALEVVSGLPVGPLAALGGLVGLVGGWALARRIYPRPRRPFDPARYPNRVIRRR
jgi:hypothetical protein